MSFSQNKEDELILSYFQNKPGTVLEIGANDGVTFSNSKLLIESGWKAALVEPSPWAFMKLVELYGLENPHVWLYNAAIADVTSIMKFHESGTLINKNDKALVSTLLPGEKDRWGSSVDFYEIDVPSSTFGKMIELSPYKTFDFISIDAEGYDLQILKQINFDEVGCRAICVEWNSIDFYKYDSVVRPYGFRLLHKNGENLLYVR